jgi:ADP-heptose:LPS heptosyltransferase
MSALLAIRPRALGDVVLLTPALRALKRGHPGAALEVVTEPRFAALLGELPEVERVWSLPRTASGSWELLRALRRRRYAWAVDFFGNPRTALLARLSGARRTAGFDLRGRRHAYRVRVTRDAPTPRGGREHAAAALLRLAAAAGGVPDGGPPRVALAPAFRSAAEDALRRAGIARPGQAIGLVAAGSWATKTWPASHAALLARRLMAAGRELLLLAAPGEEPVTEALLALAPGLRRLPPCGVETLAGVVARLGAVVGTDSGPRHLAAALDVPTYAWFGPTHPDAWQPAGERHGFWFTGLPCGGCDRTACPHWSCMPSLAPEEASRRVLAHLDRQAAVADGSPALGPAAGA